MSHTEALWVLSLNDATVKAAISNWQHGSYPSFEAMLLHLVQLLAEERDHYRRLAFARVDASPTTFFARKLESRE